MPKLLILVCLLCTSLSALADSWGPPKAFESYSLQQTYRFEVTPKSGETPCQGRLYADEALVWERDLVNRVAPLSALVSEDGQFVITMDNWHAIGRGPDVLVLYGAQGTLIWKMGLEELMAPEDIQKLSPSASSTRWRYGSFLDSNHKRLGLVPYAGPSLSIDLKRGDVRPLTAKEANETLVSLRNDPPVTLLETVADLGADPSNFGLLKSIWLQPSSANDSTSPKSSSQSLRAAGALALADNQGARAYILATAKGETSQTDRRDRGFAISLLPKTHKSSALPPLLNLLESKDVQWSAVRALSTMGEAVVPRLTEIVTDPNSSDQGRTLSVIILSSTKLPAVVPTLLATIPDKAAGESAFLGAVEIQGKAIAPELCTLLEKGTPHDGWLVEYFTQFKHPKSVKPLLQTLQRSKNTRHWRSSQRGSSPTEQVLKALTFQTGKSRSLEEWENLP